MMELFYDKPADAWEETLPIGNGSLGAMIWGGVRQETLGLNEESLWSGYYHDKNNPDAYKSLAAVRELIFAQKNKEAELLIQKNMLGEYTESYLPLGNLLLDFTHSAEDAQDYCRKLDLERSVVSVSYRQNNCRFTREYFSSYPAGAILMRFTAEQPCLSFRLHFTSLLKHEVSVRSGFLRIQGQCPEHVDPAYIPDRPDSVIQGEKGMRFTASVRLLSCDGAVYYHPEDGSLQMDGAKECVLMLSAVKEPKLLLQNGVEAGYDAYLADHIRDYQALYRRVELDLGEQLNLPLDRRLARLKEGHSDNGLYALYFQYGRYLLISSSREGGLPANLQGIWNWQMRAPWSSNYTININTQMNYWPALSCGLEECLEPYFSFLRKVCEEGKKTAAVNYHCRGFVAHHNLDIWGNTNPVGLLPGIKEGDDGSVVWAFWPMGGAWLTQELYRAYEYHPDRAFLENTVFPILREAALFLNDWLVFHDGVYVTCPSTSPENQFVLPNKDTTPVAAASAMDMTIVREVFLHYLDCCRILELEDALCTDIREKLPLLSPFSVDSRGRLMEWQAEYGEFEPGHRHLSHLYGLFPGELFEHDRRLKEACQNSLLYRLDHGGGHTGWSCAWIINLFAVLEDGPHAYEYLHTLLTRSSYPNLWDAHPPFQIDGNFGGIAGIANMLVQDRGEKVKILPALPPQFKDGSVKGLCLKGNKKIDIVWKDGKEVSHKIYEG